MKTITQLKLIIVAASLLPVVALGLYFEAVRSERRADAQLLLAIHQLERWHIKGSDSPELQQAHDRRVGEIRAWLAENSAHPIACILADGFAKYDSGGGEAAREYREGELEVRLKLARAMVER